MYVVKFELLKTPVNVALGILNLIQYFGVIELFSEFSINTNLHHGTSA